MKKKFLICSLAATAAVSAAAFAGCGLFGGGDSDNGDGSVIQNNMRFELKDDGTYELARYEYAALDDGEDAEGNFVPGYSGEGETVTVPNEVNGKAVTSLKEYAFADTGVKVVTLPDAISELPDRIFERCSLLETVNFSVLTRIGKTAFRNCANLKEIAFESGLIEIGEMAFSECSLLTDITLPDTVTTIGKNCFWESKIASINATGFETIGDSAFYKCENLTSLNMPNIVTIENKAFYYCSNISQLTIGARLETCATTFENVIKLNIDSPVPEGMLGDKVAEVTFGDGVTSIGDNAFKNCADLKSVELPATLTAIGENAFYNSGLTSITIPAAVKSLSNGAFEDCASLQSVTIEDGVESIGERAFYSSAITSLSLPASVAAVGDSAFENCNSLAKLDFSEGLVTIGAEAFALKGTDTLEIVLPSTVKTIGDDCFNYDKYRKTGITANKLVINETVETVGENAIKNCKVKELTAPVSCGQDAAVVETLTLFGNGEIGYGAYSEITALKTVNLGEDIKGIGANAFVGLEKINLGGVEFIGDGGLGDLSAITYTKTENGVKYIDNWVISTDYSQCGATQLDLSGVKGIYGGAFKKTETNDTSVLKTVALVGSDNTSALKFIGSRAFEGTGITAVEIPSSIQSWSYAFKGCAALSTIALQSGVEKIADYAFSDCANLSSINLSATDVTEIGNSAFTGCQKLRLVTLPDGIKKIGDYAFYSCKELISIDLKGAEQIGEYAFGNCTALTEAVMNSVKVISNSAFSGCVALTEYDLPATVTEIGYSALGCAQTVNFAGTAEQWQAIAKGGSIKADIWHSQNDLKVVFADGASITLKRSK